MELTEDLDPEEARRPVDPALKLMIGRGASLRERRVPLPDAARRLRRLPEFPRRFGGARGIPGEDLRLDHGAKHLLTPERSIEIQQALGADVIMAFDECPASDSERAYLVAKLRENGWNISKTAEAIDTPRSNLYKKLEQYQISQETDG